MSVITTSIITTICTLIVLSISCIVYSKYREYSFRKSCYKQKEPENKSDDPLLLANDDNKRDSYLPINGESTSAISPVYNTSVPPVSPESYCCECDELVSKDQLVYCYICLESMHNSCKQKDLNNNRNDIDKYMHISNLYEEEYHFYNYNTKLDICECCYEEECNVCKEFNKTHVPDICQSCCKDFLKFNEDVVQYTASLDN